MAKVDRGSGRHPPAGIGPGTDLSSGGNRSGTPRPLAGIGPGTDLSSGGNGSGMRPLAGIGPGTDLSSGGNRSGTHPLAGIGPGTNLSSGGNRSGYEPIVWRGIGPGKGAAIYSLTGSASASRRAWSCRNGDRPLQPPALAECRKINTRRGIPSSCTITSAKLEGGFLVAIRNPQRRLCHLIWFGGH
jgi:hypothetical protein